MSSYKATIKSHGLYINVYTKLYRILKISFTDQCSEKMSDPGPTVKKTRIRILTSKQQNLF